MHPIKFATSVLVLALVSPVAAQHHNKHDPRALNEDPRLAEGQIAPVLEGLGDHHHGVTTSSERAQMFFDQGLKLTYGFNHQEALRAFKEAARLDPDCAMAYWGWALVLGPNLNLPMMSDVVPQAWEAIGKAMERRDRVSPKERGLIEALAKRFSPDPEFDRGQLNADYAEAMGALHAKFPEDNDVATLYAAALMNTTPWDYWTRNGQPKGPTAKIVEALEGVIARDPHHEGALHYYIHAVESVDPERGLAAADLLRGLAPGAGHLVHMPSHIYMQLGRFADSYNDNVRAGEADEAYITQCRAQGIYPLTYYPHNVHFQAWAAMVQGRSQQALESARKVAAQVPGDHHDNVWGLYQTFLSMPLFVMVRFGMWEQILEEPPPPESTTYWQGIWYYARGLALAHTGKIKSARRELAALDRIANDPASSEAIIGFSNAGQLLPIARHVLAGEIAAVRGEYDEAVGHLDRAVRFEDSLLYNEPPDWYYPVRHTLGAVLLEAGRPLEAAVVYWDDLREQRDNGFALFGLWKSLEAQGRDDEAKAAAGRFRRAWDAADVVLESSRF